MRQANKLKVLIIWVNILTRDAWAEKWLNVVQALTPASK